MTDIPSPGWLDPAAAPVHPAVRAWQAHLDAGRFGGNPPTPPEVAASRDAATALFRGLAADRRRLDHPAGRGFANGELA